MTAPEDIQDEETLRRRVPPQSTWRARGGRLSSKNFELRHDRGERGVSVSRARMTTPSQLLALITDDEAEAMGEKLEWFVAEAVVGEIRQLGFEVIADPITRDPGHALIISAATSLDDRTARKSLTRIFRIIENLE